ncbi:glycoside hydrolase family 18 protein [Phanerochaete sordida]|uniref:chitinase n=1 Tax=Phanerochaete sordida TaxID=48140 RepID=A0A9P3LDH0_9APHY|nr:glycoside hydrolase family 18 protein [Phanerochaete sordida]
MATPFTGLRTLACLVFLGLLTRVMSFDITRKDNLAIYWGQDGANSQQRLSFYCQDDTVDTIPLAFLYIFRGTGGDPVIDFANTCNQWDDSVFPGTALANCQAAMEADIKTCQSKGKAITLSLGGATGQIGFSSDSQAQQFATQIWNLFLGGSSSTRPFGTAVLDGIDLDIESGTPAHYAAFVTQIRTLAAPTGKKYIITAAPQCPYPDAYIGAALNEADFDAVYVQFYNNYCGLDQPSDYNFATWDNWAKTTSFNKDVKVYIGAAGSPAAAGTGYVGPNTLAQFAADAQSKYSSFGGVMMWDADTAYNNNRFDKAVKTAIVASAAKLGAPARAPPSSSAAPSKTSSATQHVTESASSHHASASASKTSAVPVPAPSVTKKIAIADHADGDAAASLAEECAEESASAAAAAPTPDKEPRAERANSRFFRL